MRRGFLNASSEERLECRPERLIGIGRTEQSRSPDHASAGARSEKAHETKSGHWLIRGRSENTVLRVRPGVSADDGASALRLGALQAARLDVRQLRNAGRRDDTPVRRLRLDAAKAGSQAHIRLRLDPGKAWVQA